MLHMNVFNIQAGFSRHSLEFSVGKLLLFAARIKEISCETSGKRKGQSSKSLLVELARLREEFTSHYYEEHLYEDIGNLEQLGKLHFRVGFVRTIFVSSDVSRFSSFHPVSERDVPNHKIVIYHTYM